ncbi:MAG: hypothetical protein VX642_03985 [Bdellovibrionota bacterium]|nr:hypothetical protein [Bdellovibrionota bacterium]
MRVFNLSTLLIFLFGVSTWAGRESDGGHASCQEYSQIMYKVGDTLKDYNDRHGDSFNDPVIDLEVLIALSRNIKCLPVVEQDRTVRSFPAEKKSLLKYSEWDPLSRRKKIELAIHELAVLAEYDEDGFYGNSAVIIDIIKNFRFGIGEELKAEHYESRNWRQGTYHNPFAEVGGKEYAIAYRNVHTNYKKNVYRVCFFLKKREAISPPGTRKRVGEAVVVLDSNGNIAKVLEENEKNNLNLNIVETITCRFW